MRWCANPNDTDEYDMDRCNGTSRWEALMSALNSRANELTTKFNVGMGTFPGNYYEEESCILFICWDDLYYDDYGECVDMQPDTVRSNFNVCDSEYVPYGGTPLPESLALMRSAAYYNFANDTHSTARPKVIVVITDAQDEDFDLEEAKTNTQALVSDGLKVYYMGFSGVKESNMQQLATAGGTNVWYPITDILSIENALDSISSSIVSCVAPVELAEGTDPTRMNVSINNNGTLIPVEKGAENGWSFNSTEKTVTLNGTSCETLKSYAQNASDSTAVGISIKIACEVTCQQTNNGVEICDYLDNDCNGIIDDGINCGTGLYEICNDNIDNDGDGDVDEGCPEPGTCIPEPEVCGDNIDNNCNGLVDEGCSHGY